MRSLLFLHHVSDCFFLLVALFSLVACGKEYQVLQPSFPTTEFISSEDLFGLSIPTG